jgi:hypothetical protein
VLQRGERLDNLVERSNALSMSSKAFYKTAKKVHHFPIPPAVRTDSGTAKLVLCGHVTGLLGYLLLSYLLAMGALV